MYSKTKVYNTRLSDLSSIPLEHLGRDYRDLVADNQERLVQAKQEFLAKLKLQIDASHGGEESYEGDYSEFDLEGQVANRFAGWPGLGSELTALVEKFATDYQLKKNAEWFLSQMLAKIGTLELRKNDSGKYSAKHLFLDHFKSNDTMMGMWLLSRHPTRSTFLDKQTDIKHRNYCSLVPLIMSAFKRFQNVPYMDWDPSEIHGITEKGLAEVMTLTTLPEVSVDEVLAIRDESLKVKTGNDAGSLRSALTTYSLYTPAGTALSGTPLLLRIMMCQTWCAHPHNRTKYMILNPLDWDDMPDPLITMDPIASGKASKYTDANLPW